tara:strand:+ start:544 stop:1110 length:567 start_codon:yes stop_codon:yes gene_type:complete
MINNFLRFAVLSLTFCFFSVAPSFSTENQFPDSMVYQETKLLLNGKGTRTMFFAKIYHSGLYLSSPNKNAQEILDADKAMAVRLEVASPMLSSDKMQGAFTASITKSTNGDIQSISSQIDKLLNSFNDKVSVGDIFDFIYIPNTGITVLKNEEQINSISGLEFKKAFFGVWLSDSPVQENLKKAMLGG